MSKVVTLRHGNGTPSPELTLERARIATLLGSMFRRSMGAGVIGSEVKIVFQTTVEANEFLRLVEAIPRRVRSRKL